MNANDDGFGIVAMLRLRTNDGRVVWRAPRSAYGPVAALARRANVKVRIRGDYVEIESPEV